VVPRASLDRCRKSVPPLGFDPQTVFRRCTVRNKNRYGCATVCLVFMCSGSKRTLWALVLKQYLQLGLMLLLFIINLLKKRTDR